MLDKHVLDRGTSGQSESFAWKRRLLWSDTDWIWRDLTRRCPERERERETSTNSLTHSPGHIQTPTPSQPAQPEPSTYKRFYFCVEVQWEQQILAIVLVFFLGRKQDCQGRCAHLEVRMFWKLSRKHTATNQHQKNFATFFVVVAMGTLLTFAIQADLF